MADATTEFFDRLGQMRREPLLMRGVGTVRFDLHDGEGTDHWLVSCKAGDVTVLHESGKADCVVTTDRGVFEGIASGRVNAMAAMLRGLIAVEGDATLIVQFQRLFPGLPLGGEGRRATVAGGKRS